MINLTLPSTILSSFSPDDKSKIRNGKESFGLVRSVSVFPRLRVKSR